MPNPTPLTEALDNEVVVPPPPMDFAAVARILNPITDTLNESAEVAALPSPPINTPLDTPLVGSPTPSVVYRLPNRGRGFSVVNDRLAQLKIGDSQKHRYYRGTDVASSNHSAEPCIAEECDDCEIASISEVLSDDCKDKACSSHCGTSIPLPPLSPLGAGSVPIALGSPTVNPRIEEYLSFTSKDLPTQAPPPATGAKLNEHVSSTSTTALDADSLRSRVSFKSEGVTEKSNWAEELEESLERTCQRLEQLAKDEHKADPSKAVKEYYVARLRQYLGSHKRLVPVKIADISKDAQQV